MQLQLINSVIQSFKVTKVFRENSDSIKSMDFFPNGEHLVTCSADEQIVIYDSVKGTKAGLINSKKYGVDLVCFTHCKNTIVHSSTKVDHSIRHLSFYDNKYLRYFPGHTKKVTSLCVSPLDESFISCSLDKTLRLWDFRTPYCPGKMCLSSPPIAAYDPKGVIFAVGIDSELVKLYDLRSYQSGPFSTFKFRLERFNWTEMKFSGDGKTILITGNGSMIRLIDSFYGTPLQTFSGCESDKNTPIEASFSPDSQYIFSGNVDGTISVWNSYSGFKICELKGDHIGPVHCVQFNPKYMLIASACTTLAFWVPDTEQ